jgi:formiminoglutamase
MDPVAIYSKEDLPVEIRIREGEYKLGEKILFMKHGEGLKDLPAYAERGTRFLLLGIPESIGPMANYGKCCTDHAWRAFLEFFLNMHSNRFFKGDSILCLGHVDTRALNEAASLLAPLDPQYVAKLRSICSKLDEFVFPVVEAIVSAGIIPIVIGGGNNNSYPVLKGVSRALKSLQGIQAVNCDPHADFRPLEGRHSGNGFSYAYQEGYLKRYFVLGLHESYNSEAVLAEFDGNPDLDYSSFDRLAGLNDHLTKALEFLERSSLPVGMEVDMDSMIDMPSSARTPSGFSVEEVRRFIRTVSSRCETVYLHLSEGAPVPDTIDTIKVGKSLAYLVLDFMKSHRTMPPRAAAGDRNV